MSDLVATLESDVLSLDGTQCGLQSRGAALAQRAAELHARIDACGAAALEQVRTLAGPCPPTHPSFPLSGL